MERYMYSRNRMFNLCLYLFVLCFVMQPFSSFSQNYEDWPERMILYSTQHPEKCRLLVDEVLSSHKGPFSPREAKSLAVCAYTLYGTDFNYSSKIATIAFNQLSNYILKEIEQLSVNDVEKKKLHMKNVIEYYEPLLSLFGILGESDSTIIEKIQILSTYYHTNIFSKRDSFDSSDLDEALTISSIIRQDIHYYTLMLREDGLLLYMYPELVNLNSNYNFNSNNRIILNHFIWGAMYLMKNGIVTLGFKELGEKHLKERADFLLQYNEISLCNKGLVATKDWSTINWEDIKASLENDECAVIMYDWSYSSLNLIGGIAISPEFDEPQDIAMHLEDTSPAEFIKTLESFLPNCKSFYICPVDSWENIDIAYDNPKIHIKHSLADLRRYPKSSNYKNGLVTMFADIDYGRNVDIDDVPPLNEGKLLLTKARELFGDKMHGLSGNNVSRDNFLNVIDDVSIFHVSTHGILIPKDIVPKSNYDLYSYITGNTAIDGYGLALSKYNDDHIHNFISAKDIGDKIKFSESTLVFLDACETGKTRKSLLGTNGLAKTLYVVGAKTTISYITKVNEKVATDFALYFYEEIYRNSSQSYHDIFYKVKRSIIEKYKGTEYLNVDKFGRPDIGVILWE